MRCVVIHSRIAGQRILRIERSDGLHRNLALPEHERPRGYLRTNGGLVCAEVEDLWSRTFFRLAEHEGFALHNLRDFARRIVQIPEDAAFSGAHAHARGFELVLDAVRAEVALLS